MSRIILSMDEVEKEIITILEKEKYIALATCSGNHVTARTMSHVNSGFLIFFQTDMYFIKIKQILENPRVALCTGNMQIEGTAYLQGHPLSSENAEFCSLYKAKHPHSFNRYASIKDEVVIKVEPSLFTLWKYIDEEPCRDYLNLLKMSAYREFYRI